MHTNQFHFLPTTDIPVVYGLVTNVIMIHFDRFKEAGRHTIYDAWDIFICPRDALKTLMVSSINMLFHQYISSMSYGNARSQSNHTCISCSEKFVHGKVSSQAICLTTDDIGNFSHFTNQHVECYLDGCPLLADKHTSYCLTKDPQCSCWFHAKNLESNLTHV